MWPEIEAIKDKNEVRVESHFEICQMINETFEGEEKYIQAEGTTSTTINCFEGFPTMTNRFVPLKEDFGFKFMISCQKNKKTRAELESFLKLLDESNYWHKAYKSSPGSKYIIFHLISDNVTSEKYLIEKGFVFTR